MNVVAAHYRVKQRELSALPTGTLCREPSALTECLHWVGVCPGWTSPSFVVFPFGCCSIVSFFNQRAFRPVPNPMLFESLCASDSLLVIQCFSVPEGSLSSHLVLSALRRFSVASDSCTMWVFVLMLWEARRMCTGNTLKNVLIVHLSLESLPTKCEGFVKWLIYRLA